MPRQSGRLIWCLRHYAWVVIACTLALAAAPLLIAPSAPTYQADALVVGRQLTVHPRVLPQLAATVFADGAVEARVASDPAIHGDTDGLIPDRLSVVAAQDSIAMVVQARDPDPATAVRLADLAAAALVDELNRGGAGVGAFALQAQAVASPEPLPELAPQVKVAIGALAGLVLGLGIVALTATIRRPVVTAQDVEGVAGVPLLGTVQLPPKSHGYPGPLGVRGIATVARWLASVPPGRLMLISPPSVVAIRHRIYVMAAVALSTLRSLRFEAPRELVDAIHQHRLALPVPDSAPGPRRTADELVLVDGGSPLDIVDPLTENAAVVAVAPRGVSRRRLRTLTVDYMDGGLVGVVLVEVRRGLRRGRARRSHSAALAPATAGEVERASDVPEPERA